LGRILKAGSLFALVLLIRSAEAHSTQVAPAPSVWDKLYFFHAQADRTVWDGVYVHPQADRGEVNFSTYCASCHQGGGAPIRSGGVFRSLAWRPADCAFQIHQNEYIKTNMPPDNPGSLEDWEYLDTVKANIKEVVNRI